jgi:hypothetical protein
MPNGKTCRRQAEYDQKLSDVRDDFILFFVRDNFISHALISLGF